MKQVLEFEKPIVKLREEIDEAKKKLSLKPTDKLTQQVADLERKMGELQRDIHANLSPWQRVQISRHIARPYMLDYVKHICDEFVELHGDRHIGDDNAMPAGFATIGGQRVAILGHQKGRDTKENLLRNFGSAHPEGYRKALRLMRMAEKFSLPVVALIDTPGAFPGIGAEERNIAEAIAFNLREMMTLRTPVIAIVIGEGGSGGALGIGIADKVLMMENAYYSVISPEGCAAILWKHREHAPEAASALKLSAQDLSKLGIIDGIIPEPLGGAHNDHATAAASLKDALLATLAELAKTPAPTLLEQRYQKFRALGQFTQG
ncbi:MAG: acetyl-CoA carboxylase carboxyltransferase subunit alpha [Prosthecobacter sp.]|jgi:acetyl-CoA carboxylase carboxyl transferase subunit alpha|uniref:acetyl-CoA carboxylase carboxyltransferase subunit alpha n=1 Tax=Prosthecobacter sp. TaxID=1965333 RepID=UPI0019E544AE|nr:acetyl-CoA carboxylase carboxyltransferase subunit alpha [Prosthecobacter sp.]MBE2287667.1 acetyl-CoA carboxylase carboxyltransferase subunit alpha [Prosthecobacter sp.]